MSLPLDLQLYHWATRLSAPLTAWILGHRAKKGKEDPDRLNERLGRAGEDRPTGTLVWLHAASVGESLLALELVHRLSKISDSHFLVTTGTTTSARLMAARLPTHARHQYIPIDRPACVRRFLDQWTPDIAIFLESELWPNLLLEIKARRIPAVLANARMNSKSLRSWGRRRQAFACLLDTFHWIGAADDRTARGISELTGRQIDTIGNLKLQIKPAPVDSDKLEAIRTSLESRPVWLAASTHDGEDEIILAAHKMWLQQNPGGLLILVPRHPERADDIEHLIRSEGFMKCRRSQGEFPDGAVHVWLADTLGELPLWFASTKWTFIGGSLVENIGGHNPVEATQNGCSVMTGPFTASFDEVFAAYTNHNGVLQASNAREIADALATDAAPCLINAQVALANLTGEAMTETLAAITDLLPAERI
ncbi:MAG: 3-deoxy-D-manno-octulosonic acid transferase [Hyphobacterium sp.]|nr:MAG: 3-deoxy-D-manno-octulosonic acid transferase [Hyphobacterium sp.]